MGQRADVGATRTGDSEGYRGEIQGFNCEGIDFNLPGLPFYLMPLARKPVEGNPIKFHRRVHGWELALPSYEGTKYLLDAQRGEMAPLPPAHDRAGAVLGVSCRA